MAGVAQSLSIRGSDFELDNARVVAALKALMALGADPEPILRNIATLGESSTRERFATETGPGGERWAPSLRARLTGGKTLTQDGHLGDSITSRASRTEAEWGTNVIYGGIHQFGGEIRARNARALRFRLASGEFAIARRVTLPARPFLGISDADEADILDLIQRRIEGAINAR